MYYILTHHGIKGQKWGVRRFQNPDGTRTNAGKKRYRENNTVGPGTTILRDNGRAMPAGKTLYRVSMHKDDPVFDNKRYVSLNKQDNKKWANYFDKGYGSSSDLYQIKYKTIKEIKIAPETELGRAMTEQLLKDRTYAVNQTLNANRFLRIKNGSDGLTLSEAAARNVAAQTELGRQIIKDLKFKGWDAMADTHGTNVADNPVIVFDPDDKMERISSKPLRRKYK